MKEGYPMAINHSAIINALNTYDFQNTVETELRKLADELWSHLSDDEQLAAKLLDFRPSIMSTFAFFDNFTSLQSEYSWLLTTIDKMVTELATTTNNVLSSPTYSTYEMRNAAAELQWRNKREREIRTKATAALEDIGIEVTPAVLNQLVENDYTVKHYERATEEEMKHQRKLWLHFMFNYLRETYGEKKP